MTAKKRTNRKSTLKAGTPKDLKNGSIKEKWPESSNEI